MRTGSLPAGAAAHRGPLALQSTRLPGVGFHGGIDCSEPPARTGGRASAAAIAKAFAIALAMYALVGLAFGFTDKSPQAVALGAILIFGVAYLLVQGLADAAPRQLTQRMAVYSAAAAAGYFALQSGAVYLTAGALPATPPAGPLDWAMIVIALLTFGFVALIQSAFPLWSNHPAAASLRVHLSNGLYANAYVDRLLGGWATSGRSEPLPRGAKP